MIKQFIFLMIAGGLFMASCSKGDASQPFTKIPFADSSETKMALDSTNFGVYKGVLAGSSGHVKIYFNNGDTILKAYLTLDSLSDTLTCLQTFTLGTAINRARFTGRISGFSLSASDSGLNAKLEFISVNGHSNVIGQVAHEMSTQLVYCFESNYSGTELGNFNFIRYGKKVAGVAKCIATGETYKGNGIISGDVFSMDMPGSISSQGSFQGGIDQTNKDRVSGTWLKSLLSSGVFSGVRTL